VMNLPGGSRFERQLRRGARLTNLVSGMAHIHDLQTMMTARLGLQKFTDIIMKQGDMADIRLKPLGLTREELENEIAPQFRKYASTKEGLIGVKFQDGNFDQWDDQEAAAKLIGAMTRFMSNNVQSTRVGLLNRWVSTDLGRIIMQFRTFSAAAWRTQGAREIQALGHGDPTAAVRLGLGSAIAALAFAAQTQIESIGMKNREEHLEKELGMGNLAAVAFQRNGVSSFAPMTIDMVSHIAGGDPIFENRNSQLAQSPLNAASNPTTDLAVAKPLQIAPEISRAMGTGLGFADDPFSDQDLAAIQRTLPFGRLIGIEQVFNAMGAELPDEP